MERDPDAERLVIRDGGRRVVLASVAEAPLTFGGTARFQVENLLAASLAAYVQGVPAEKIREGILSFAPSAQQTPGRMNVLETPRGRVIVDYAHNQAAIAALLAFVAATPAAERIAVLGVPGDRRDEDLRAVGRLAASMDYVIFKEHHRYRRGRPAGEGARILAEGLLATGFPAERIATFSEEDEAVAHAAERMKAGCVVAVTADSPDVGRRFEEAGAR